MDFCQKNVTNLSFFVEVVSRPCSLEFRGVIHYLLKRSIDAEESIFCVDFDTLSDKWAVGQLGCRTNGKTN